MVEIGESIYGDEFNEKAIREEEAIWFTDRVKYRSAGAPQQVQYVEYTVVEFCSEDWRRR